MDNNEFSREELENNVAAEAESNVILDELANKDGEITLDDLRNLPGAAELSDEELQAAWSEAQKDSQSDASQTAQQSAAEQVAAATGGEAVQTARGWKVFDEKGNEVADFSKLSANDFLKHQIEYPANGKQHRKSLDELVRVASYGHYNEGKLARMQAERDNFYKELSAARPQLETLTNNQRLVSYAMQQFHLGNDKPLSQLLEAVKANMGALPNRDAAAPAQPSASEAQAEQAGQRIWYENIQPAADSVAAKYAAKPAEVRAAVRMLIDREPAETLTWDKINEIVNTEVPMLLEQHGYRAGGIAAAAAPSAASASPSAASSANSAAVGTTNQSEVAELRKQIAELQAKVQNSDTAAVRARSRALPPGSAGRSPAGDDTDTASIPAASLKSKDAFRSFLRS